jgi:stearoyl-CoA desaturase (Delta-9 desaturase)
MVILIFLVVHWYASFFLQSFFHHRYAAHHHFSMSRNWEKFFYISSFIVHGSSYISPYAFGIMHRLHHMHTDKQGDPHSPSDHPGFFAMLWETRNSYFNIYTGKTRVEDKLKKDLPKWKRFDKIAHNWVTKVAWALLYTVFYILFARRWWMYTFLPLTCALSSVQGTLINWWAHKFGYVNYPMDNTSKNIFPFDVIFCGDAYHNNHHKFPGRLNNSHRWFEVDFIYYTILCMHKMHVVRFKNRSPYLHHLAIVSVVYVCNQ